jgi:hypothetical protein
MTETELGIAGGLQNMTGAAPGASVTELAPFMTAVPPVALNAMVAPALAAGLYKNR